eukprot:TRINITY_DN48_c1_g1_i8.p2 TRINITY_DN48_c1_g1~~TRINITY_DN48_c1_g1_i8.p2  ORF type:complete len:233 (+),score=77.14 TRINITY_DN48_c1_g1_i8:139-837(+)
MKFTTDNMWELTVAIPISVLQEGFHYQYCMLDHNNPDLGVPRIESGMPREVAYNPAATAVTCADKWGDMPKLQKLTWEGWQFKGELFRSPMPLSTSCDPGKNVFDEWVRAGIDVAATFATPAEMRDCTGLELLYEYWARGVAVLVYPVPDLTLPRDAPTFEAFLRQVATLLERGARVVVHCHAGIGRTCVGLACLAKRHAGGAAGADPVAWVQSMVRGSPNTPEAVAYVNAF